jgi:hypothetical protein
LSGIKWIILCCCMKFPGDNSFIKSQKYHDGLHFDWNKILSSILVLMGVPDYVLIYSY